MAQQGSAGNVLAALCSLFIPGLGQLLQGRVLLAAVQFGLAAVSWFVLMGWVIHLWSVISAARYTNQTLDHQPKLKSKVEKQPLPPSNVVFSDKVLAIPKLPIRLQRPLWLKLESELGTMSAHSSSFGSFRINDGDWVNSGDVLTRQMLDWQVSIIGKSKMTLGKIHSPICGRLIHHANNWFDPHPQAVRSYRDFLCVIEVPKGEFIPQDLESAFKPLCDALWENRLAVFQNPMKNRISLIGNFPFIKFGTSQSWEPWSDEMVLELLNAIRGIRPVVMPKSDEGIEERINWLNLHYRNDKATSYIVNCPHCGGRNSVNSPEPEREFSEVRGIRNFFSEIYHAWFRSLARSQETYCQECGIQFIVGWVY